MPDINGGFQFTSPDIPMRPPKIFRIEGELFGRKSIAVWPALAFGKDSVIDWRMQIGIKDISTGRWCFGFQEIFTPSFQKTVGMDEFSDYIDNESIRRRKAYARARRLLLPLTEKAIQELFVSTLDESVLSLNPINNYGLIAMKLASLIFDEAEQLNRRHIQVLSPRRKAFDLPLHPKKLSWTARGALSPITGDWMFDLLEILDAVRSGRSAKVLYPKYLGGIDWRHIK
jgi:hypothetical protein